MRLGVLKLFFYVRKIVDNGNVLFRFSKSLQQGTIIDGRRHEMG